MTVGLTWHERDGDQIVVFEENYGSGGDRFMTISIDTDDVCMLEDVLNVATFIYKSDVGACFMFVSRIAG